MKHYHRGMVQSNKFSYSLINQSINAVKLYYQRVLGTINMQLEQVERPEKPFTLSKVLSKTEVARILNATDNLKHRCLLQLLYAGGLRIGEVINLKISDVKSDRNLPLLRGGKGKKTALLYYRRCCSVYGNITNNTDPKSGFLKGSTAGNIQQTVSGMFLMPR